MYLELELELLTGFANSHVAIYDSLYRRIWGFNVLSMVSGANNYPDSITNVRLNILSLSLLLFATETKITSMGQLLVGHC